MDSDPTATAILRLLLAVGTVGTAFSVGYVAHYDFGSSQQEIRIPSVVGAAVIGLLLTAEHFGKKLRKPDPKGRGPERG
jgi:hypothetical protein